MTGGEPLRLTGHGSLLAALALSTALGRAFVWEGFRRRSRTKAGFLAGFLEEEASSVRLFAELSGASVQGGAAGESDLAFAPGTLTPGNYRLELPGEASLLAAVRAAALPLGLAAGASTLIALGATHGLDGDTFETSASSWLYWMKEMGFELALHLDQAGFAPRGGGEMRVEVQGSASELAPLRGETRAPLSAIQIVSAASSLPTHVHQRQAARARSGVSIAGVEPVVQLMKLRAKGSGSTVAVTGLYGSLPVTTAAISERGKSTEQVGERAAQEFRRMFSSNTVVPPCLVASLLVAAALSEGRSLLTTATLPKNLQELVGLVAAFSGREARVESGKPGQPGVLAVEPRSLQ